jgi:hypothetical protein
VSITDDELDLINGDPERAERIAESGSARSRRIRAAAGKGPASSKSSNVSGGSGSGTTAKKPDTDLVARFRSAFDKLADRLAERDEELSAAISEESEGMAKGLVSVTRTVPFLRAPLFILFGILEPILAFWRVGSIFVRRWLDHRDRVHAERALAQTGNVYDPPSQ